METLPSSRSRHDRPYEVAAYYFPGYHTDPRNERRYGNGWTEWRLLREARPRFPGHYQPRVPLWGHEDEADPAVMDNKLAAAADHGVGVFLFDWYWYDGPFLNRALDEGYLRAANRDRVKFALMWANHNWVELFPRKMGSSEELLYSGSIDLEKFEIITDHVIRKYFTQESYWKIDGCPYFSIYDFPRFVGSFGADPDGAVQAIRRFRDKTKAAGFPDLHLNLIFWQENFLPGTDEARITPETVRRSGFDSVTSYVWVHHIKLPFPTSSYLDAFQRMRDYTVETTRRFASEGIPYFPNVTMGWDSSPRTDQSGPWHEWQYPFNGSLLDNTPANFRIALESAREHVNQYPETRGIVTVNAWNEWTEGSYLEPDIKHRYGYLEAIREVFGLPHKGCLRPAPKAQDRGGDAISQTTRDNSHGACP